MYDDGRWKDDSELIGDGVRGVEVACGWTTDDGMTYSKMTDGMTVSE